MTKRVNSTQKNPLWLSNDTEEATQQRDKLLKAKKHEEFKKQKNKLTSLLRASKFIYFYIFLVASKNDSRSIWKPLTYQQRCIKASSHSQGITPEKVNSHFANVSDTVITYDKSKLNGKN